MKDSLGTSRFCCTAEHVVHLPLTFVLHSAGAASLFPQHGASAGSRVTLERTGYTGEDWLYWQGQVILVRTHTCSAAACFLYTVVISPAGKYSQ